ncbi:transposase [Mycobacterium tuberculosis]|nr:transposase [Mycobacterium tuberculosis]
MHPGRDSARQTVALSSRSAPIGDYFSRAGRRSNSPGNAWLADSRMLIVALPDNGVGSGLTSITAVPRASARSGKPAAGLLDDYRHASTEYALGSTDFRLLADKAYSHPSTRAALRSKKIKHTIPERHDQIDRRKAKGSAGGRPPAFDAALYGLRNTVERGFHRLKQWRGIATRYDKYALTYLGGVLLACAVIHARVGTPKLGDTP